MKTNEISTIPNLRFENAMKTNETRYENRSKTLWKQLNHSRKTIEAPIPWKPSKNNAMKTIDEKRHGNHWNTDEKHYKMQWKPLENAMNTIEKRYETR